MRAIAIFNQHGGTFRTVDIDAYCRHAGSAFAAAGHDLRCRVVSGAELKAALEGAFSEKGVDAVVAGGGDGTISAAAGLAWQSGIPLGIIPAGTMNLFARALGIPLDIWKAPAFLADGGIVNADIGTANGHPFVHQFSAGLHSRMVRLRNAMQFSNRLGKIAASLRASAGVMLDPPVFDVTVRLDGHMEERTVSAVSVSNNPLGSSPYLVPESTDAGHLGIYFADPLDKLGAMRLARDLLTRRLKANPAIREMTALSVELHFPRHRRSANCVIDGELLPLPRDISLKIHPGELKILTGHARP